MQFHHHGYVSADPRVEPAAGTGIDRPDELPDKMDVLVVGAGPAGMITAAQLSQFPQLSTRIVEKRPGRLEVGQADGVKVRTVETFQAFGFAGRVIEESYHITELAVWRPDPDDPKRIMRTEVLPDDPDNLSEFPHLVLNQARVQDYFAEFMANAPARIRPDHGIEFVDLAVREDDDYPVAVTLRHTAGEQQGRERVVHARYVVGCDGAHSRVRKAIGCEMQGKQASQAWGVIDAVAETDFPDIRKKCIIQSHSHGNILHVPREGGYLFRMYVELDETPSGEDSRRVRQTTFEDTMARANAILHPYTIETPDVVRYTVYEVGHRLTNDFDDSKRSGDGRPRVFITGDACHTHSAKAGLGMNVSMQDGFNLGWKIGHVATGLSPASLLETYSSERQEAAEDLIEFDMQWSSLMAKKEISRDDDAGATAEFYAKNGEFPTGLMTAYKPSIITGQATFQSLAAGFPVGKRFHSAPVVRVCDATPQQLGHLARADGRWRIYVFAGAPDDGRSVLADWAQWMAQSDQSPLQACVPDNVGQTDVFDIKLVCQQPHTDIEMHDVPEVFRPRVGPFRLVNLEQVFAIDPDHDIFEMRGIDRQAGAVVIVRPDQYVAQILPLSDPQGVGTFFSHCMLQR